MKKLGTDEDTILVGHSSRAVASMKFAEKNKILGSVLVGVYADDLGDENEKKSGYFDTNWDWQAIKSNQKWIAVFASTDDPYIPIEQPTKIKDELRAEYYEFSDRGHFGQKEFSEIVDLIVRKIS